MAWLPISGTVPQYSTINNNLAADYYLKFYASGTTTPINMATDATGSTELAKCALSDDGYPITNPLDDSTRFIPHIDQDYRIVLYTNEDDADNNNTAAAAFNIDGMVLQVVPTANASDVAIRDTDMLVLDDFDRSPLFVDGDGFTAGAGPHVITVPTDWTPTNPDMRFYRLDNSGIVTPLTPTSTSSTTFTLTETLLSTDTIFIGDDNFRDLNIATQAEANEESGSELITVSTLAGRTASTSMTGIVKLNDTLTSDATDEALTASQGKALANARDPEVLWTGTIADTGNPSIVDIDSSDLGTIETGTYLFEFTLVVGSTTFSYGIALMVPQATLDSGLVIEDGVFIRYDNTTNKFQINGDTGGSTTLTLTKVSRIPL